MARSISASPQSRLLPPANNLLAACEQVIEQPQGDPAIPFIQAIQSLTGQALVNRISRMINNYEIVGRREEEVKRFPNLLTIEDYVWRYGAAWGFNQATIESAHGNAWCYDQAVAQEYGLDGFTRYI